MTKRPDIRCSQRITELREYYLHHSPVALDRTLNPWKSHRALLLYYEGWRKNVSAPTIRLRRSMAEAYMLENMQPVICPKELLVGQPDYHPFSPEEQKLFEEYLSIEDMIPEKRGRCDHFAPDYQLLLDKGITGMIAMLDELIRGIDLDNGLETERYEYYLCSKIELEGLLKLCINYAQCAEKMADSAQRDEKQELLELVRVLKQVPAHPARTLREALQSIRMFNYNLFGIYSFGHPDRYLLPYYRRDIENHVLTEAQAQELIDCFCLLSVPTMSAWAAEGFMLGGRDEKGCLVENELTWHFLASIGHTHIPDPNIGFCVTEDTGDEILDYTAQLILEGHCQPQIWNNDAVTRSMKNYGFDDAAANNFTLSTCVETTPAGCSGISITSPYINLLNIFLEAFYKCDDTMSFEEIFCVFQDCLGSYCKDAMLQENLWQLERGRNMTDPVRISLLVHDCIEKGMSHDSGGARYNQIEPNILGMQNVTESFNMVRRLVFEEKVITIREFQQALRANYAGYEELLFRIRNREPHFGTGIPEVDALAKRVADAVLAVFQGKTTVRGAVMIPGAFSYRDHEIQGRSTGASPDGRIKGMPLNDASCPVQGYDNLGPTLSLASTVSWQPSRFLGGTSVNVKLNREIPPDRVVDLIRGYLKTEGAQLQFNVVDAEELRSAQQNPEQYRDLLVRIGGYSDFFIKIPESLQNEVISRYQA